MVDSLIHVHTRTPKILRGSYTNEECLVIFLHCRTITNYAVWRIMNNRIKDLPDRFRQYLGEYLKARNCFVSSYINLDRLSIIVYFLKIKINSQFSSKLLILNTVCTIRLFFWYILHNRSCTVPPTFAPDGVSAWT